VTHKEKTQPQKDHEASLFQEEKKREERGAIYHELPEEPAPQPKPKPQPKPEPQSDPEEQPQSSQAPEEEEVNSRWREPTKKELHQLKRVPDILSDQVYAMRNAINNGLNPATILRTYPKFKYAMAKAFYLNGERKVSREILNARI
jgi:outer membrane biosynthesis protein TonB